MEGMMSFDIFGDLDEGPVPEETRRRIFDALRTMSEHFTWSSEPLGLELYPTCAIQYCGEPPKPWAPQIGWGGVRIGSDMWCAALTMRYLRWVSTQLSPKGFVRVCDESGYVTSGYVLLSHGAIQLDNASLARQRTHLKAYAPKRLAAFDQGIAEACAGRLLRHVSVLDYLDRPELQKIRSQTESSKLRGMTLEDAADSIAFHWAPDQAQAA